jgi:hypothetical protein
VLIGPFHSLEGPLLKGSKIIMRGATRKNINTEIKIKERRGKRDEIERVYMHACAMHFDSDTLCGHADAFSTIRSECTSSNCSCYVH